MLRFGYGRARRKLVGCVPLARTYHPSGFAREDLAVPLLLRFAEPDARAFEERLK